MSNSRGVTVRASDYTGFSVPIPRWRVYEGFEWFDVARELIHEAWSLPHRSLTLLSSAELVASGRSFTMRQFRLALPRLVKTCPCGRKAIYRLGVHGRCRLHRDTTPDCIKQYRVDIDQGQIRRGQIFGDVHAARDSARRHHAAKGKTNWRKP